MMDNDRDGDNKIVMMEIVIMGVLIPILVSASSL